MKRLYVLVALTLSLAPLAWAQGYSYLRPPTLAVMDFEVSMTVVEKVDSSFYGGLVSQALLSVLVQQNAAARVEVPVEDARRELIRPGDPVYTADAAESRSAAAYKTTSRLIFPPIFKIYDKKYVELALQNSNFTVKDLYAKSATAYAYADLDFLVLGNVYETRLGPRADSAAGLGFNVRVLNTKRAEELYSYSAVVNKDLRDLPLACSRIAQAIMRDILNNHCAQFALRESDELVSGASSGAPAASPQSLTSLSGKRVGGAPKSYDYSLFWQPRQVVLDDASVAASSDTHKRAIDRDVFYWALPGQYVVSVYNREVQQLKAIDLTLAQGDIRHVFIEKQHLESERGTVTVSGVLPSDTYKLELSPIVQRERYWWEIEVPKGEVEKLSFTFDSGELSPEAKALGVEYRPATGELFIPSVKPAGYEAVLTAQPPAGASGVTGWWKVSTRSTVRSAPLPIDLRAKKDVKLTVADFKLQARKALEAPRKNKVSFIMNPGFSSEVVLVIDDSVNSSWFYWRDNEKVTVSSEYSQADWDTLPKVSYRFLCSYTSPASGEKKTLYKEFEFQKSALEPARDTVLVLDFDSMEREWQEQMKAELKSQAVSKAGTAPVQAALVSSPNPAPAPSAAASSASVAAKPPAAAPRPAASGLGGMMGSFNAGIGSGTLTYYTEGGTSSYSYSETNEDSGMDLGLSGAVLWPVSPTVGLGGGAYLHLQNSDETVAGFNVTFNMAFLAPAGNSALLMDIGVGSGFSIGAGLAFLKPGAKSGFSLKFCFMTQGYPDLDEVIDGDDYPARNSSFTIMAGILGLK